MFLCRRQLLRVHFPKFGPCHFDVRSFSSHASRPTPSFDSTLQADCVRRCGDSLPSSPRASASQGQKGSTNQLQSALDQSERLSYDMDAQVLEQMIRIATKSGHEVACEPLIRRLHPLLLRHLRSLRVPTGTRSLTYYPPRLVHEIFGFVHKLVTSSRDQLALDMLHVLLDQGFIPTEAFKNSKDADARTAVTAALVRASLHWNWKPLGAKMLSILLGNAQPSDQFVHELAVDTSYALLVTPQNQNIRDCLSLFLQMHRLDVIPPGLVRQFYESASDRLLGEQAATFYSFSRSAVVLRRHRYPPPQGKALAWLMKYLTSKRMCLARQLVEEVVTENLQIIAPFRARFISLAASQGYSSLARQLWNRYSIGKDSHLIVGSSFLMLRMTSLYAYLIRRTNSQLQEAGTDGEKDSLTRQLHDLILFRDHIFRSYRKYHSPLIDAPHRVITSFARACFIIERFALGFKTFKILLKRKEIPDMYDINVALSAVAKRRPHSAIAIINRLKARGIQPDAVSFATVMHFAKLHGDSKLALEMKVELRRLDRHQMSLKSVAALVRATVSFEDNETRRSQRQKLQDAMDIIEKLTSDRFLPSPQTGKYLVIASLHANDPVMAYRFWNLLLRNTAEWMDGEQVFQRRLISERIQHHWRNGWLDKRKSRWILRQLVRRPNHIDVATT